MDRYKSILSVFAITMMVFGLSMAASAQYRDRRNDDNYSRNDVNISYAIKNLRNSSRRFEDTLDRELDRSRYDGTRREDNLNELAERFKNAAEDLDDEYEGRRSMRNSSDEARRVVNYGSQLDVALSRAGLTQNSYTLMNSWASIERDMYTISRAYNIRYNGTYGRNRGDNRGTVGNRGNRRNLRATVQNLKNASARFENLVDREYRNDRNRYDYGQVEDLSNKFKRAADRLADEYKNDRDYDDSRNEARKVVNLGEQLDRELARSRMSSRVRSDWNRIESDLRVLANAYNVSYNGTNNRNGIGLGNIIRGLPF